MKVEISNDVDTKSWDNELMKNKHVNAFQMSGNYEPYRLAFNSIPLYISVQDQQGNILAQLLAVQHQQNLTREPENPAKFLTSKIKLGSIIHWNYGPVIHDDTNKQKIIFLILERLEKYVKDNKVLMINGTSIPSVSIDNENKIYGKFGYTVKKWDTWITNLSLDADTLFNSLHNKVRYDIRKAEKNNLTFEIANKRSDIDEWMKIKYINYKNRDAIIRRYEKFNDYLWDISYKHDTEKMYLARSNGELINGIANKLFNNNIVQHSVINSQPHLQGGSFLTWNTIKWSQKYHYLTYDVGGANPTPLSKKEQGIRHFKSKWAGTQYEFSIVTKIFSNTRLKFSKAINSPSLISSKLKNMARLRHF